MRRLSIGLLIAALGVWMALGQVRKQDEPVRLPDGRSQTEEILKADHERNLKDAGELLRLSEELKIELEKNDRHVLSMGMVKKTEEIEKIAKRIRGRMKRF